MNFQQLKIVREAVRQNFNLTEVGRVLCTTQSAVSKNILELEAELEFELFIRRGKRLTGLSPLGETILPVIERILSDATNLKRLAGEHGDSSNSSVRIGVSHSLLRHGLGAAMTRFLQQMPGIGLECYPLWPDEIPERLRDGSIDFALVTEPVLQTTEFISHVWLRQVLQVVVPEGHVLTLGEVSLEALVQHPLVTYSSAWGLRAELDESFRLAGLVPELAVTAADVDLLLGYVAAGLGVGLMALEAVNLPAGLVALPAEHLFADRAALLLRRRTDPLRDGAQHFIEALAPGLFETRNRKAPTFMAW